MIKKIIAQVMIILIILVSSVSVFAVDYQYDELNRLLSATYGNGQRITYTYDASGNIKSVITVDTFYTIGDVNGDNTVDVGDAILVLKSIVGLINLDATQFAAADVNGDEKVDVGDAILILRYIVGLIMEFP